MRSAKYKGDVEVTGDVGVGGDIFLTMEGEHTDLSLRETLTAMQAELDAHKNTIARLGGRVSDIENAAD